MNQSVSRITIYALFFVAAAGGLSWLGCDAGGRAGRGPSAQTPLRVVVMDPLADKLACACVPGYAQRRYGKLCAFLSRRMGRPVEHLHAENLSAASGLAERRIDLIIGKSSVVRFDAAEAGLAVRPIARLTDKAGSTELTGLFVVRRDDPARSIGDLKGRTILLGPAESVEKHQAAIQALRSGGVELPQPARVRNSCTESAVSVVERQADAAVISSYALALLEGCDAVDKGALRVVGQTAPVPFVTVFATERVGPADEAAILKALLAVRTDRRLLIEMESRDGFVAESAPQVGGPGSQPAGDSAALSDWPDWRGPRRDGICPFLPDSLPARPVFMWRRPLTGPALAGVAATLERVVVADKDPASQRDIWRCLDAESGRPLWQVDYPAEGEMDYTNSPRATPVIRDGLVYLLGAFGDLHCVRLADGHVVWKKNIIRDFGGELTQWGVCATPLVVGDRLLVNPGGREASVIALDRRTGQVAWKAAGPPAGYASFILGRFGGVEQVVGYDAVSLGGWDVQTGRRLWQLVPPEEGDFNVPTPIQLGQRLLVATENNGARLYGFDRSGSVVPEPLARNKDLAPDTSTPVVVDGLVFGCSGRLVCLDAENGLAKLWEARDKAFEDYASLIGGAGRVLITPTSGELLLIRASRKGLEVISRLRLFDYEADVWSHPAVLPGRLYVRSQKEIVCLRLENGS